MEPAIEATKETCASLIGKLSEHTMVKYGKFAFVAYRDHP
jgi:hypothetical protein